MLGIDELLPWLVLALGGAMLVGNGLALLRPPERREAEEGDLEQAPLARTLTMMAIGAIAAIWAVGSLIAG